MAKKRKQGRKNGNSQGNADQNRSDGKAAASQQGSPGKNRASDAAAKGRPMGLTNLSGSGVNSRKLSGATGTSKPQMEPVALKPMTVSQPSPLVTKAPSSPPAQASAGQASSGVNWASAAANSNMMGFASVAGSEGSRDLFTAGGETTSVSSHWAPINANKPPSFGQPSPAKEGFSNDAPAQPAAAQPQFVERCLEDLYREYPDKRLRGIGQEGIQPAIMVLGQVAQDATFAWIRTWCPFMNWNKVLSSLTSRTREEEQDSDHEKAKCPEETASNAPKTGAQKGKENLYLVPETALNSRNGVQTVIELFHRCAVKLPSPQPEQLSDLTGLIDYCTRLCEALRDGERAALFVETRRIVQWTAVGLDCKKLEIYRTAAQELRRNNAQYQVLQVAGEDLAVTRAGAQFRSARRTAERRILDQAAAAFNRHREQFTLDLLRALESLLKFPPGIA